jgi:hypothetical protein
VVDVSDGDLEDDEGNEVVRVSYSIEAIEIWRWRSFLLTHPPITNLGNNIFSRLICTTCFNPELGSGASEIWTWTVNRYGRCIERGFDKIMHSFTLAYQR